MNEYGSFATQPLPVERALECANPLDGITSCPPDSPLRGIADIVSAFSFAQLGGWTQNLANPLL